MIVKNYMIFIIINNTIQIYTLKIGGQNGENE